MTELKYEFAFNSNNEIIEIKEAVKGTPYFLDRKHIFELIVKAGSINVKHFSLKGGGGTGEIPEHYNLKMKIAKQGCFFYGGGKIEPYKIEVEYYIKEIDKRPDIVFFDENNDILCCIEVCHTNPKKDDDIKEFNKLNLIVYECYTDKKEVREISNTQRANRLLSYISRNKDIKEQCKRKIEDFKTKQSLCIERENERIREKYIEKIRDIENRILQLKCNIQKRRERKSGEEVKRIKRDIAYQEFRSRQAGAVS